MKIISATVAFGLVVGLSQSATATTIIDTLPPMPMGGGGYIVEGPQPMTGDSWAAEFVSPGDFELTGITLDLSSSQSPASVFVEVLSDENGSPSTPVGPEYTLPAATGVNFDSISVSGTDLSADTTYWLAVFEDTGTVVSWSFGGGFPGPPDASNDSGKTWQPDPFDSGQPGFELDGTISPELPTSVLLSTVILGFGICVGMRRYRR